MRKIICILLTLFVLVYPKQVLAAEFTMNIHVIRQEDGTTSSELCYNDRVIWRLVLLPDGAKTVSGSYNTMTTFIVPDVIDGLFLIKLQ